MHRVECVWPIAAALGEGPLWSASEQALWFVDIKSRQVHRFHPATTEKQSWRAPDQVTFIMPRDDGQFIVGLPGQLACFTPASGTFESIATLEPDRPRNRTNDACVDARGRLWFGSMDDDESAANGALYSWDRAVGLQAHDQGYVISNGPTFSPDGRAFYHTDTSRKAICRFDVSPEGALTNKRPFVEIEDGAGWPDGSTVDADGCLWIALYGGWGVRRYSPQGRLLETIAMPCANVTKLAFGGPDLKTAYVTTARKGLSPEALAAQPLAGGLFAFATKVRGLSGYQLAK